LLKILFGEMRERKVVVGCFGKRREERCDWAVLVVAS
jgi:hypothetical protein